MKDGGAMFWMDIGSSTRDFKIPRQELLPRPEAKLYEGPGSFSVGLGGMILGRSSRRVLFWGALCKVLLSWDHSIVGHIFCEVQYYAMGSWSALTGPQRLCCMYKPGDNANSRRYYRLVSRSLPVSSTAA